ncbi:hypothetical protein bhYOR_001199 (plasmid) [Borrelia nietonii YOR]|nr:MULTISPECIES: hypothetical protein [Borrelia]UPA09885.1 hypothetical protein bhYOR_001199 [Borrelia nietonii YOR]
MVRVIIVVLAVVLFIPLFVYSQDYFPSLEGMWESKNPYLQNVKEEKADVFKDEFDDITLNNITLSKVNDDIFSNQKNKVPKGIIEQFKLPSVTFDKAKLASPFNNLDINLSFIRANLSYDVKDGQIESGSQRNQVVEKVLDAKLRSISLLVTKPVKKILGTDYFPEILHEMKKRGFKPRHLLMVLLGFRTEAGEEINVEMNFDHLSIVEQALEQKDKVIDISDKTAYAVKLNFPVKSENHDRLLLPGEVKYDSSTSKIIFRSEGELNFSQNASIMMQKLEIVKISLGYVDMLRNLMTVNQLRDFLDENTDAIL